MPTRCRFQAPAARPAGPGGTCRQLSAPGRRSARCGAARRRTATWSRFWETRVVVFGLSRPDAIPGARRSTSRGTTPLIPSAELEPAPRRGAVAAWPRASARRRRPRSSSCALSLADGRSTSPFSWTSGDVHLERASVPAVGGVRRAVGRGGSGLRRWSCGFFFLVSPVVGWRRYLSREMSRVPV